MTGLFNALLIAFLVLVGGLPTLYLTVSVPAVLGYKIYRKVRYKISLMD